MKRRLIVFPMNGNGLEALDCLGDDFELVGFVDDVPGKRGRHGSLEVFSRDLLEKAPDALVLAVPGSADSYGSRRAAIESLGIPRERFAQVVHPRACVSDRRRLGANVLLMAGVVVTSNARIGNHVCVLPNSVVHHDAVVGDFTIVGSNATVAGGVQIGEGCYVGSAASILSGVRVGDGALIGLGSTVIRDVAAGTKVAGSPAREIP
ncbi:UDP-N-acetylbacillosamine N-acetyltransferase [Myxococcaceae bacterium]|jgi:sugar O-acyltransferase (sialic acid O-acetyltransferase NeuD family)|nr:UDP-N-acetylbacillosamine N-acetyltransferase [Myxococcaceae bacterium]